MNYIVYIFVNSALIDNRQTFNLIEKHLIYMPIVNSYCKGVQNV